MELRRLLTGQPDDPSAPSPRGQVACGVAALLLHAALACALPQALEPSPRSTPSLVWLDAELGQPPRVASLAPAAAGAFAASPTAPATRRSAHARADAKP